MVTKKLHLSKFCYFKDIVFLFSTSFNKVTISKMFCDLKHFVFSIYQRFFFSFIGQDMCIFLLYQNIFVSFTIIKPFCDLKFIIFFADSKQMV